MANPRTKGTRQDTWVIRLNVAGEDWGIFDKKTGGEVDSEETKYKPGRMGQPIVLGGSVTMTNVVLQRLYDRDDDHGRINTLINGAGKATCIVSQRPMDPDGNEYGKSIIYSGRLKRTHVPDTDSESNGAAMLELEVSLAVRPIAA